MYVHGGRLLSTEEKRDKPEIIGITRHHVSNFEKKKYLTTTSFIYKPEALPEYPTHAFIVCAHRDGPVALVCEIIV